MSLKATRPEGDLPQPVEFSDICKKRLASELIQRMPADSEAPLGDHGPYAVSEVPVLRWTARETRAWSGRYELRGL